MLTASVDICKRILFSCIIIVVVRPLSIHFWAFKIRWSILLYRHFTSETLVLVSHAFRLSILNSNAVNEFKTTTENNMQENGKKAQQTQLKFICLSYFGSDRHLNALRRNIQWKIQCFELTSVNKATNKQWMIPLIKICIKLKCVCVLSIDCCCLGIL